MRSEKKDRGLERGLRVMGKPTNRWFRDDVVKVNSDRTAKAKAPVQQTKTKGPRNSLRKEEPKPSVVVVHHGGPLVNSNCTVGARELFSTFKF